MVRRNGGHDSRGVSVIGILGKNAATAPTPWLMGPPSKILSLACVVLKRIWRVVGAEVEYLWVQSPVIVTFDSKPDSRKGNVSRRDQQKMETFNWYHA
ncbi:hypothetical protein NPIL_56761 [Nephila pilipes]|uniref:Uncharacterized protein n=1 Tax=Nephila pilipes TaxID=299642 RepID=A0A8X6NXM7_NEPPI|nr:hypothetical protein NPIL_56761 [Nephila pilipes]